MNDIYSFYQLICKYKIEIPIIQRDYAQGRTDAKSADVRKSLVKKMIDAVNENDKSLFFDFVYGRVDGNKFIPFDGQQRLTTLFLFHKYVFEKCQSVSTCNHKKNCICNDILRRFSYATRQSSREFCEVIVEKDVIPTEEYEKKLDKQHKHRCIQCFVENQSWFYPDWKKDPTIVGMMTMLDEIHHQISKNSNFQGFAERLTSGCNCPITFHFVDMGEHKMSDETYVKMNARGKTLTPFENFKASLEQYLEEKSKTDLLNRWKGNYDEPKQIYTGIDGIWLDLFWKVANQGKEGAKELPDTLIMSFFNRHFMNVWRCWYAKNTKTEKERNSLNDEQKNEQDEYDAFNKRIQEEMPLYPSKDNFVPFDIYEYVIDKCGVENCLSPIFNIWDALCEKDNSILSDCQAVWNRKENEPKWNLYFGDKNNDNRETYPSRVAFYALMRYFINSSDTTSLSQWMRVVWNIIENSTIDSAAYHAALRLIENFSAKSHTIYNALANEFVSFELGNQYHAKKQVEEECIKASKILNGIFSENDIIYAESHRLLKGCISTLFENDDCEKVSFSQSLKERTDLLSNLWLQNETKNYKLVKVLISQYDQDNPSEKIPLIRNDENWKNLVTDKLKDCFRRNNDNSINEECKGWKYMLSHTTLIDNCRESGKILGTTYGNVVIWATRGCSWHAYENVILDDMHCNPILADLVNKKNIECNQKVNNCHFFWGWNIRFKYKQYFFTYYFNNTVCLMNENWNGKKIKDPTTPDAHSNNFYFEVEKEETTETFLKKLDGLITASQNAEKHLTTDDEQTS